MSNVWLGNLRRLALWAVPAVLVLALVWSTVPRGRGGDAGPPKLPAVPSAAAPAGGGVGAPSPGGDGPAPPQAGTPARSTTGVTSGEIKLGNLVGTDGQGHMRWQILADDMVLGQSQRTVALSQVRATFFNADGTHMRVTGAHGAYDTRTREITVTGEVHGVTSSGRELFADTVYYSPTVRQVEGRGHVRVVQERVIMYADSMVSDLALGQTRFFGNVHMTLR